MQFEWDERKNEINEKKHGITFEMAILAFHDPYAQTTPDNRYHYHEERWHTLGYAQQNIIHIAHTIKGSSHEEETIRIISARKATPSEIRRYYTHRKDD